MQRHLGSVTLSSAPTALPSLRQTVTSPNQTRPEATRHARACARFDASLAPPLLFRRPCRSPQLPIFLRTMCRGIRPQSHDQQGRSARFHPRENTVRSDVCVSSRLTETPKNRERPREWRGATSRSASGRSRQMPRYNARGLSTSASTPYDRLRRRRNRHERHGTPRSSTRGGGSWRWARRASAHGSRFQDAWRPADRDAVIRAAAPQRSRVGNRTRQGVSSSP